MELVKLNVKAKCDLGTCRNVAAYVVSPELPGPRLPWRREAAGIYLCRECLEKLYEAIGRELIPKSPDSLIKKAEKRREKNERG